MRQGFDNIWPGEDALDKLKLNLESKAESYGFELRIIGGLLKFTPISVHTHVFLELEEEQFSGTTRIYKHRNYELTVKWKGRAVSQEWVEKFIQHNSDEARRITSQLQKVDNKANLSNNRPEQSKKIEHGVARAKCSVCDGDGRWLSGDTRDGDMRFEYCSKCSGAGYVNCD